MWLFGKSQPRILSRHELNSITTREQRQFAAKEGVVLAFKSTIKLSEERVTSMGRSVLIWINLLL